MDYETAATDTARCVDVKILLPEEGVIRIESARLFAEPDTLLCRRFVRRVFLAPQIDSVTISGSTGREEATSAIELRFDATQYSQRQVLEHVAALLDGASSRNPGVEVPSAVTARDQHGAVRYRRYGQRVTGWRVV